MSMSQKLNELYQIFPEELNQNSSTTMWETDKVLQETITSSYRC